MSTRGRVKVTYIGTCDLFRNRKLGLELEQGESALVTADVAKVLAQWPAKFRIEEEKEAPRQKRSRERRPDTDTAGSVGRHAESGLRGPAANMGGQ
jgi:hypothetical protein